VALAAGVTMLVERPAEAGLLACPPVTTNTVLTSDCAGPLTIDADRITVNLNGHSVVCPTTNDNGVEIPGHDRVRLLFGTVTGCQTGVRIDGGDRNVVVGIQAIQNAGAGIAVEASSHDNQILFSTASGSLFGIVQNQGSGTRIAASRVVQNSVGILDAGINARVTGNQVLNNETTGILLEGSGSRFVANWAVGSQEGIRARTIATNNTIARNVALSNDTDLVDDTAGCGSNRWSFNWFTSANQSCIH
jgi:hypothetical protein